MVCLFMGMAHAETHVLYPIDSARTSPSSNWGSCCGVSSFDTGGSTISINACTYQGGYCMGDTHRAVFLFEMPQLTLGSTIDLMVLNGGRSGATGSGSIAWRWTNSPTLSTIDITDTIYSPDVSQTINWSGGSTYSITTPSAFYEGGIGDYLMVSASIGNSYAMSLSNSGSTASKLVFSSQPGCPSDFDANGSVDVSDVLTLLGAYGTTSSDHDLDGDDYVGVNDLLLLLDAFGECP
ncbi:MAG: hypothetical protein CMJ40_09760 [Phycisphaerae bacterium]|nr:hypothetical protein [Phycisphaerae bacterium]